MATQDAFALQNSSLNSFLFAEVGPELNGSTLTVLSVLARLDEDPWAMASSWSKLPGPAVIERLAERIRRMPLGPQALSDARTTAARLCSLLPGQTRSDAAADPSARPSARPSAPSRSVKAMMIYGVVAIFLAMNVMLGLAHQEKAGVVQSNITAPQTPSTDADSR